MIPFHAYRKLYPSLREHRQVELKIASLLNHTLSSTYIDGPTPHRVNPLKYAQKNFFSILFLSIYRAIGITPERRLLYGCLNHCLRGIVTGADNLLDDEYKEMLPLAFPAEATRFKSVMHILLFDRFLFKLGKEMKEAAILTDVEQLQDALFAAIVPIGAEEASEEGGIRKILPPAEILSSVHMYKGGKLLCLAFVAPLLLETASRITLQKAEQGIYSIGLALQIIDDLTDFYEDIAASNHNYLISSIAHKGTRQEKDTLKKALTAKIEIGSIEALFPATVKLVMAEAIGEALRGFYLLEESGFWCNQVQAHELIRHLFVLRGVKQLLPFFPEEPPHISLLHHACP